MGFKMYRIRVEFLWTFLLILCTTGLGADGDQLELKHENDVFVLSDKNFHHIVGGNEIVLVLFHVPWDPQYRNILPEYEKAGKKLAKESPSVLLGRLDVSLYPDIAEEVDIRGDSVQFLFFHFGKPYNWYNFVNTEILVKKLQEPSQTIWNAPRPHPELVTELSDHDFEKTIQKLDFSAVLFYRENCPACVRFLVEYETALVNLTASDSSRYFKVNLDKSQNLASQYEIDTVPSLKLFRQGKKFDVSGRERLAGGLIDYIKRQQSPGYKEFSTVEEGTGWARSHPNKAAVVGIFESKESEIFEAFVDSTNYLRQDLNFAWVKTKPDTGDWQVITYPPRRHAAFEDKKQQVYKEKPYFESLVKFINESTVPLVGQRTTKNKDTIYARRPLLIGYFSIDWTKNGQQDTEYHRNKLAQVAPGFRDMTFAISDRKEFKHELIRMGLDKYTEEVLVGIIGKNGEYYPGPVEDVINLKHLTDFAANYRANKLKPYHRTQSPPTSDDDSGDYAVKVVVGATFRKLILRHDKQTLLLCHRPLCPACKNALTTFTDIAEEKSYSNLVFTSMDTSANDPPARFSVSTYPTLFFISSDKREQPIRYPLRDFTKAKIKEFIDKHYSSIRYKSEL